MKLGRQQLHFYTALDAEVIEVPQDGTEVASACDELFTEGLGPCIGVAFSWKDRGFMFHAAGIQDNNEFEAFLAQTCEALTNAERSGIRPVVAGGNVTHGLGDYVLDSRSFCIAKLMGAGFGPPHECWCPSDSSQDLYLDVHHNKVRVHTETESLDFTSNSSGTFVDLVNT